MPPFILGEIQIVKVGEYHTVCNMIGQHNVKDLTKPGLPPPIRYDAIDQCLKKLMKWIDYQQVHIHAPFFGTDRAGGKWEIIEPLIIKHLSNNDVPVFIYKLK